ncbi:hypothetical protein FQN54_009701 [Arachnomyces sp. PD_36]|nr:hypothetical protein FQN54_009701 [Arachnomyces sp. PD_36]
MATATTVKVSTDAPGIYNVGVRADSAETASKAMQENLNKFHIYFNDQGFHNHIVHYVLTRYALGASPESIQNIFDQVSVYQRPVNPADEDVVRTMADREKFKGYLEDEKHYTNFLAFFQREIEKKGVADVLNEHLFAGDEHADDMLVRVFAGFLHPIIHLGFGLEFNQPAVVAEALAQTAIHDAWIGKLFYAAEKAAGGIGQAGTKSYVELLDEIRADEKLSTAAHWADGNKIRDGILKRAPEEMLKYASQYKVQADQLDEKLAEMINGVAYYTGAAQHPPKQVKIDFYFMHCVNSTIFFPVFFSQPWLTTQNKVRLLEWKGRLDLAMYASRRSPKPLIDEIKNYGTPRSWKEVFDTCIEKEGGDGHVTKMARALAHGERFSKPYEAQDNFRLKGDMWLKLGNMLCDSAANSPSDREIWVRSAGFDEAWEGMIDRANL